MQRSGVEKGLAPANWGEGELQRGWGAGFSTENRPHQVSSRKHISVCLHACVCVVGTCS